MPSILSIMPSILSIMPSIITDISNSSITIEWVIPKFSEIMNTNANILPNFFPKSEIQNKFHQYP